MTTGKFSCGCCADDCIKINITRSVSGLDEGGILRSPQVTVYDTNGVNVTNDFNINIESLPADGMAMTRGSTVIFKTKGTFQSKSSSKTFYLYNCSNVEGDFFFENTISSFVIAADKDDPYMLFTGYELCQTSPCTGE